MTGLLFGTTPVLRADYSPNVFALNTRGNFLFVSSIAGTYTLRFEGEHIYWGNEAKYYPLVAAPDGALWAKSYIPNGSYLSAISCFDGQAWAHFMYPFIKPALNVYFHSYKGHFFMRTSALGEPDVFYCLDQGRWNELTRCPYVYTVKNTSTASWIFMENDRINILTVPDVSYYYDLKNGTWSTGTWSGSPLARPDCWESYGRRYTVTYDEQSKSCITSPEGKKLENNTNSSFGPHTFDAEGNRLCRASRSKRPSLHLELYWP